MRRINYRVDEVHEMQYRSSLENIYNLVAYFAATLSQCYSDAIIHSIFVPKATYRDIIITIYQ